eukprot:symbB.v1.2.009838.t1/scaffold628.1/size179110/1
MFEPGQPYRRDEALLEELGHKTGQQVERQTNMSRLTLQQQRHMGDLWKNLRTTCYDYWMEEVENDRLMQSHTVLKEAVSRCCRDFRVANHVKPVAMCHHEILMLYRHCKDQRTKVEVALERSDSRSFDLVMRQKDGTRRWQGRVAAVLASLWAERCFSQPDPVLYGTRKWIENHVARGPPQLCPWALRAQLRLWHWSKGQREAEELLQRLGMEELELLKSKETWPTSLVALSHEDFEGETGLVTFSQLWKQVEASKKDAVHLLAFHPCREDRGPGCRANPLDAGHFSVRAPWPTLQLLRTADLNRAREEWMQRNGAQGSYGALGIGSWADCYTPTEVWFPDDDAEAQRRQTLIYQVAAGTKHSVALTTKGHVFTWGHGGHGRLGLGQAKVRGQNSYSAEFVPRLILLGEAMRRSPRAAGSGVQAVRRKQTPSRFFDLKAALANIQMPEDFKPQKPPGRPRRSRRPTAPSKIVGPAEPGTGPTRTPSPNKTPSPGSKTSEWRKRTVSCARAAVQQFRPTAERAEEEDDVKT